MFQEYEIPNLSRWLFGGEESSSALLTWLIVLVILSVGGLFWSLVFSAIRRGPAAAAVSVFGKLGDGLRDLVRISPRRVYALSLLAVQEAVRRRIFVALAVFMVILLFAGWFLDPATNKPAELYLTFLLTAMGYLTMVLALFLSAFSLPTDMANRTIYTVVTKPVHSNEIVLGRIIGFSAIGTLMLVVMGLISYIFINRAMDHTHEIDEATLVESTVRSDQGDRQILTGQTKVSQNHHHTVTIDLLKGVGRTDVVHGHWHEVTIDKMGDKTRYVVGPPQDLLTARVPLHATRLSFRDPEGNPKQKGENVGNVWEYRSFVAGATRAAAIWEFDGIRQQDYPDGLPLNMTLNVFRTYKGKIEEGIRGSIVLRNPTNPAMRSRAIDFVAQEFTVFEQFVSLDDLQDPTGQSLDLYGDGGLAPDGRVLVEISCLDAGQYFGVALPDLYVRAGDASFFLNYTKGCVGIWFQMVLVTSIGVMFSTFLNAAVAMLATMAIILGGFFSDLISRISQGQEYLKGPFESFYRTITSAVLVQDMEPGATATVLKVLDYPLLKVLSVAHLMLPDMGKLSDVDLLAGGFDIPLQQLGVQGFILLGFFVPLFVIAHFVFKNREIAR